MLFTTLAEEILSDPAKVVVFLGSFGKAIRFAKPVALRFSKKPSLAALETSSYKAIGFTTWQLIELRPEVSPTNPITCFNPYGSSNDIRIYLPERQEITPMQTYRAVVKLPNVFVSREARSHSGIHSFNLECTIGVTSRGFYIEPDPESVRELIRLEGMQVLGTGAGYEVLSELAERFEQTSCNPQTIAVSGVRKWLKDQLEWMFLLPKKAQTPDARVLWFALVNVSRPTSMTMTEFSQLLQAVAQAMDDSIKVAPAEHEWTVELPQVQQLVLEGQNFKAELESWFYDGAWLGRLRRFFFEDTELTLSDGGFFTGWPKLPPCLDVLVHNRIYDRDAEIKNPCETAEQAALFLLSRVRLKTLEATFSFDVREDGVKAVVKDIW